MASLVFDYDGTLHDSLLIYAPAFRLCYDYLVKKEIAIPRNWQDGEISHWLGFSAREMWASFMPVLSQSERDMCSAMIGEEMIRMTLAGRSKLYPHALNVLQQLCDKGHELIFLSNCKHSYMNAHRDYWGLDKYFSSFYCTEDFLYAPKWQIFDFFKANCSKDCIIIGDRRQDIEVAKIHQLLSIGCNYGYGEMEELNDATIRINTVEEIISAVQSLI